MIQLSDLWHGHGLHSFAVIFYICYRLNSEGTVSCLLAKICIRFVLVFFYLGGAPDAFPLIFAVESEMKWNIILHKTVHQQTKRSLQGMTRDQINLVKRSVSRGQICEAKARLASFRTFSFTFRFEVFEVFKYFSLLPNNLLPKLFFTGLLSAGWRNKLNFVIFVMLSFHADLACKFFIIGVSVCVEKNWTESKQWTMSTAGIRGWRSALWMVTLQ